MSVALPKGRDLPHGGDLLVSSLINHGVRRVFGLPGIQLDPLFDALARQDVIKFTPARHEQAVTYMADGFARATGRPGVGIVVPGPGVLNALAGLSTAYACRTPVLLICGQIEREIIGSGRGALHEIPDQTGMLRSLTRWHGMAFSPAELPSLIGEAFAALEAGQGPAALEVPVDVLHQIANEETITAPTPVPQTKHPDAYRIDEALQLVRKAQRPLLIAGGGCCDPVSASLLTQSAELLRAPVIVTENGKGAISHSHELAFERSAYRHLLENADLVVALGTRFVDLDGKDLPTRQAELLIVNTDPAVLERQPEQVHTLQHDVTDLLTKLVESDCDLPPHKGWKTDELANAHEFVREQQAQIAPQLAYLEVIRQHIPDDGIVVGEYTQVGYAASFAYPCRSPHDFIWPGYQGTLGYGFATAIGAAIGNNETVICITGDGGFSWTMEELSTLARERPPLITIIFNDGHYGNVQRIQRQLYAGREIATELTNPDYMRLSEAFGIESERISSAQELANALRRAIHLKKPKIIEVIVGEFPSPWHLGWG